MKKLRAIVCYIRGFHKYNYYSGECIKCGRKAFKEEIKDKE
ncbi:hypothetical protein NSQ59_05360 [Margalitia sp. FSL K6-0131]